MGRKGNFNVVDRRKGKEPCNGDEDDILEKNASVSVTSPHVDSESPSHVDSENESQSDHEIASNQPRKVRGPTLMSNIWELEDGIKMVVIVGSLGIPVGNEAAKLSNFLGTIVRRANLAPIMYDDWRLMDSQYKKAIWELVEAKVEFRPECNDKTKKYVMRSVGRKWKEWKNSTINRVFNEKETPEEMWEKVNDIRVEKTQFISLANFWLSDKHKKMCSQNRENISKLEDPHCSGTKSFARIIQEKKEAKGATPSRADIYVDTRKRKNGDVVNEKAKSLMDQLLKYQEEGSGKETVASWQGDSLAKVKGPDKKGRTRCVGPIAPSTDFTTTTSSQNVESTLHGILELLTGVAQACKQQLPNSNMENIIDTARQLVTQIRGNEGNGQISDARSAPQNAHNDKGSTSSNHQPSKR